MEWQEKTRAPAEYLRAAYDPKTEQAEEPVIIKALSYTLAFTFGAAFWYAIGELAIYLWRTL